MKSRVRLLGERGGDSVHVALSIAAELAALLGLAHELHLLKLLHGVARDMSVALPGVAWSAAAVDRATVDDAHTANAHGALDVKLSRDGGGGHVKPVVVYWRHLLLRGRLGVIGPLGRR